MPDPLALLGRDTPLFAADIDANREALANAITGKRILVVGGAGSIGSAVVKRLFALDPAALHVVDLSENNLAELVRDIRSSLGYGPGSFHAYCVDLLGPEFDALIADQPRPYDLILHFAALKHVRSEKDPFTLMRMIRVNVLGTQKLVDAARATGVPRLFAISTDKAASPINLMGATKRLMEGVLLGAADALTVSSARFANVLFSDGSLPCAWEKRLAKGQPIVAPRDAKRFFITHDEAASLCLLGATATATREVVFPNPSARLAELSFDELARRYLEARGLTPILCNSEDEARATAMELGQGAGIRDQGSGTGGAGGTISGATSGGGGGKTSGGRDKLPGGQWPVYFFDSDTTGEKASEAFYEPGDAVDLTRFEDIGVLTQPAAADHAAADFVRELQALAAAGRWDKPQLVQLIKHSLHPLHHEDTGRYLDGKM